MKSIKRNALRVAAATVASGLLATGAVALAGSASASTLSASNATSYRFATHDNTRDLTFNQLLGINDEGVIAGYFGSGAQGHPNKGYLLLPPYGQGSYVNENFPGSVQTQVTGLNNRGVTVGFWSSMNTASMSNNNFGFVDVDGHFRNADFPTGSPASPPVDQLLGVNDSDVAVGFYTDANGTNHGYEYNINTTRFSTRGGPVRAGRQPDRGRHQRPRRRGRLVHQPGHRQHRRVPAESTASSPTWPFPARPPRWRSASTTTTRSSAPTRSARAARRQMHGFTWQARPWLQHRR